MLGNRPPLTMDQLRDHLGLSRRESIELGNPNIDEWQTVEVLDDVTGDARTVGAVRGNAFVARDGKRLIGTKRHRCVPFIIRGFCDQRPAMDFKSQVQRYFSILSEPIVGMAILLYFAWFNGHNAVFAALAVGTLLSALYYLGASIYLHAIADNHCLRVVKEVNFTNPVYGTARKHFTTCTRCGATVLEGGICSHCGQRDTN